MSLPTLEYVNNNRKRAAEMLGIGLRTLQNRIVHRHYSATHGHIHGTPVFWEGPSGAWVYVMGEGDNLKAYPFQNRRLKTGPQDVKLSAWRPPHPTARNCHNEIPDNWMPGGILTVSSNGTTAGTGIVWALVPANGDANSFRGVKGMLMAFNAENVSEELWRSQGADSTADTPDSFGLLARFCSPPSPTEKSSFPTPATRSRCAAIVDRIGRTRSPETMALWSTA